MPVDRSGPSQNSGRNGSSNLRHFRPGESGNPGGRPKSLARATRELLDARAPDGKNGAEALAELWIGIAFDPAADLKLRLDASRMLADRGWGRAPADAVGSEVDDSEVRRHEIYRKPDPKRLLELARLTVELADRRPARQGLDPDE